VSDNGNGISPENQRAVFHRFKQLGESIRSSTKGFGLGLNIAKELVELNLGHIAVESKVGCGSTFSFTLPPADPTEVLRPYLMRSEMLHNGSTQVSLIQADVDESLGAGIADDVHTFLSCLLRSADLLFRVGLTQWLVVLPVAETEVLAFRQRVEKTINAENRIRLSEPLPDIRLKCLGAWSVINNHGQILDRLCAAIETTEASCP